MKVLVPWSSVVRVSRSLGWNGDPFEMPYFEIDRYLKETYGLVFVRHAYSSLEMSHPTSLWEYEGEDPKKISMFVLRWL